MSNKKVVCFGEVLWDSLPKGMFLGGAPLNVALNLNNLGVDTTMVSAVGDDKLGKQALKSISAKGLGTDFIQVNNYATGLVDVEIDAKGDADYTIHAPASWDHITYSKQLQEEVDNSKIVVFGTLIFREDESRATLKKLLNNYNGKAIVDVNLRKPFYDEVLIDEVLDLADIAKVNHEELEQILGWKNKHLPDKEALIFLSEFYGLEMLLLTWGEDGSILLKEGQFYEQQRFHVKVKDTVGTGDAFLAGAIFSLLEGKSGDEVIAFANAMGAFVASKNGATPDLDMDKIEGFLKDSV